MGEVRAEGVGFEPTRAINPTRFRDGRTRPGYATPPCAYAIVNAANVAGGPKVYQPRPYICSGAVTPTSPSEFASTCLQAATNFSRAAVCAASSEMTRHSS